MPKGDAMSSTGFSISTTWATRICKKNFISRIQVQPHGPTAPGLSVFNDDTMCGDPIEFGQVSSLNTVSGTE